MKNFANNIFLMYDIDGSHNLTLEETTDLLKHLNINRDSQTILEIFQRFDKNHNNTIDLLEFRSLL